MGDEEALLTERSQSAGGNAFWQNKANLRMPCKCSKRSSFQSYA